MTTNLSCLTCLLRKSAVTKFHSDARLMFTRNCHTVEKKDAHKEILSHVEENGKIEDLTEPTTCCMSGCVNCVWIQYAEKLSKSLEESNEDLQKIIMDKVQDPNMRAFLTMEMRVRKLIP